MADLHGATMVKDWMDDFAALARSGKEFKTSAGAEPGRKYAYLEWRDDEEHHSILLFQVEVFQGELGVRAYRFDGSPEEVRERVDALVHYHS